MATEGERREHLAEARVIVIKLGSRVVLRDGGVNEGRLARLAAEVAGFRDEGRQVLLVSSGAVGLGLSVLGLPDQVDDVSKRQAAAAVGQSALMQTYQRLLAPYEQTVAQILLTTEDIADRERYLHIRNTTQALLASGAIPVFNENDSVSVAGVTFGENDKLAALVASKIGADVLIFLTETQGLYTADPASDPSAEVVRRVEVDDRKVLEYVGKVEDAVTKGGMLAKINAARTLASVGIPAVIARGSEERVLSRIIAGEEVGTFFAPRGRASSRKSWIATALTPEGAIVVDDGAKRALVHPDGASLLPAGVVEVVGEFGAGAAVSVVDSEGVEIARGLVNYSAAEARKLQGAHSSQIREILGRSGHEEIVHRDNLVLT
ncbi:MAG: glutamate 5-kinase [Armatimonadota bacterium]